MKNKPFTEYTYQELFAYNSNISTAELSNSQPLELERDMIALEIQKLEKMPKSKYKETELKKLNDRDLFLETLLIQSYQS